MSTLAGPTRLDIGLGRLGWTWAQCQLDLFRVPTRLEPSQLDLDLDDLARLLPRQTWLDLGLDRLGSSFYGLTQLNLDSDRLSSIWARVDSTRHEFEPT